MTSSIAHAVKKYVTKEDVTKVVTILEEIDNIDALAEEGMVDMFKARQDIAKLLTELKTPLDKVTRAVAITICKEIYYDN